MNNVLSNVRQLLENAQLESYSRYDGLHPFDIFLGLDDQGRKSLVITLDASRERVVSSKTIAVDFFVRPDGRHSLRFSLEDDELKDIFYKFCENIIESTQNGDPKNGFSPIIQRWETWISFFQRTTLPLTESEILGLIGEIYFLQNVMIERYGQDVALESYIGTDRAHKDFAVQNTWFEVKSIHNGVRTVKISSIEQLDSNTPGKLEIITFDQSTSPSVGNISLNQLISGLRSSLEHKWQLLLDEKLRKTGYIEDERYNEFNYLFVGIDEFAVDESFPKLRKSTLPSGITKASYEIDISAIQEFKV